MHNILEIHEDVAVWPDITPRHRRCVCLGGDNKKYDAHLLKSEIEINKILKDIKPYIVYGKLNKLTELIEQFGEDKYQQGSMDEMSSNAESDM